MKLRTEIVGYGGRWGNLPKHIDVLECDGCSAIVIRKHRSVNDKPETFCSRSCALKSLTVQAAKRQTCLKRYGVEHISQLDVVKQRKHSTRKSNGTYRGSRAEDSFYRCLCDWFGIGAVHRQVLINRWTIDFHVTTSNVWVQFDGVYWHGLNKPYEMLSEKQRYWFSKDRVQDEWFRTQGRQLVRVTDQELRVSQRLGDWSNIVSKLGIG